MNFDDYDRMALEHNRKVHIDPLAYSALALCGEAGEYAEKVKRIFRDPKAALHVPHETINGALDELGDVLWCLSYAANTLGHTLEDVANRNLQKLEDRAKRGVIYGTGDNR